MNKMVSCATLSAKMATMELAQSAGSTAQMALKILELTVSSHLHTEEVQVTQARALV